MMSLDAKIKSLVYIEGKGYFAVLRLYGPTETAMDRSWKPGDIELVK